MSKEIIYGMAVLCFIVAGTMDFMAHEWKLGTVAMIFALANGVIFFWR